MGTRLQSHIYCTVLQQIDIADHRHGIDFGMGLATLAVPTLAEDFPVRADNHCTHHGIGRRVTGSLLGQLQRTAHVSLVNLHKSFPDGSGKTHLAETVLDDAYLVKTLGFKQTLDLIAKSLVDFQIQVATAVE